MKTWVVYGPDGKSIGQVEAENMVGAMSQFPNAAAATVVIPYRRPRSRSQAKRLAIQTATAVEVPDAEVE